MHKGELSIDDIKVLDNHYAAETLFDPNSFMSFVRLYLMNITHIHLLDMMFSPTDSKSLLREHSRRPHQWARERFALARDPAGTAYKKGASAIDLPGQHYSRRI